MLQPDIIKGCAAGNTGKPANSKYRTELSYLFRVRISYIDPEPAHPVAAILLDTVTDAPLILVVDDDMDTREMYGWCLEARGFRVALAGSFAAALEQAASETPDLVVTDFMLPGG